MDVDGLAQSAVDVVARHLIQRRTDAAGRLADADVDHVYQLIASRLRHSSAGQSTLAWFHQNPADEHSRWQLAQAVTSELHQDPEFARSLGQAVGGRQFYIGRLQFGTGVLVAGVIFLVVFLGGATVAVTQAVTNYREQGSLSSVVGRWERPYEQPLSGLDISPTVLTISPDGRFTFSAGIQLRFPVGETSPNGFLDLGSVTIECSGTVEPMGDRFTMHTTAGECGTFEARISADGRILDVFLSDGPADGSTALKKVDS